MVYYTEWFYVGKHELHRRGETHALTRGRTDYVREKTAPIPGTSASRSSRSVQRGSRRSTMLGAFAVPRRRAWMIGLAAHRLRDLHARRRRWPSACRIAEPRHDRAESAESNGNSETNQPTAMLRVNGASCLSGVVVRFIHRWQYARVRAVRAERAAEMISRRVRALGTSTERNARANRDVAKWHEKTGTERPGALKRE